MTKSNTTKTIHVSGMTCVNCAKGIEKHLTNKGVEHVSVDFSNATAQFSENNEHTIDYVIDEINSIGFKAQNKKLENDNSIEKLFSICLFFTIPLFLHMFLNVNHFLRNPLIQLALCLPVYFIGCYHFGRSALGSLKIKTPNMDVLIMIGSSAAFFYSIVGMLLFWQTPEIHTYLFFETTATIITLVLLGNLLEHKSVIKTTSAIKELNEIQNLKAKKETSSGDIREISFNDIQLNDILLVNSGDKVPTDGNIINGEGYFNESMITGESKSVYKTINENVIGGTILVDGNIKIKAEKIGKKTVLSTIIKLVKNAQSNKPNIQRIGDKVSSFFVPFVILFSLLTFLGNFLIFDIPITDSILRAIAVLVISCPCAMGLATPTAVMVGLGRAAKLGILIKGGATLEEFAKVNTVVFDKTGTLTSGKFKINKLVCDEDIKQEVVNIIYNLEIHSSHPIAKSIVKHFKTDAQLLEIENIKEFKGQGIKGKWMGNNYKLGSSSFVNYSEKNYQLFLQKEDRIIAKINCNDELKEEVASTIKSLKSDNFSTVLLSGDKTENCQSIADKIGIETIHSEQLPIDKLKQIEHLNSNSKTAMVGDGINDAPALAKADIGISVGGSTQIAMDTAQIVLLNKTNLKQLHQAYRISKHTLLTIKQNLFWAFSYNLIAIPIAAIGLLNPMWGALFMAFSDIIVIGNSLRLKRKSIF